MIVSVHIYTDKCLLTQEPNGAVMTRAGPWELPRDISVDMEMVCLPCPPCSEPVSITCLGGHEVSAVHINQMLFSVSTGQQNFLCQN